MLETSLNLVVIRSTDLDRAARFYSALGINLTREHHGSGPEHLAGQLGAIVFEVYPQSRAGESAEARIGFRVGSVSGTVKAVLAAGGSVASQPKDSPWGYRAVVVDPDGHKIELVEAPAGG
ncbi:MAG TPA: VOC family protein [Gemmataceae bacterium]|nr:VOC family protein [Gemmataceae bacterium]